MAEFLPSRLKRSRNYGLSFEDANLLDRVAKFVTHQNDPPLDIALLKRLIK